MSVTLQYIETCLPCYLQDHHNRAGEQLFGVPVSDGASIATYDDIRNALQFEFDRCDLDESMVTDSEFGRALADKFPKSVLNKPWPMSADENDSECCAWFLLSFPASRDTRYGKSK